MGSRTNKRQENRGKQLALIHTVKKLYGEVCMSCGSTCNIEVDHIKSWARHPSLRYKINNLQVLCQDCNEAKGSEFSVDFRTAQQKEKLRLSLEVYKAKKGIKTKRKPLEDLPENYKELAKELIIKLTEEELKILRKGLKSLDQFYKRVYFRYRILLTGGEK